MLDNTSVSATALLTSPTKEQPTFPPALLLHSMSSQCKCNPPSGTYPATALTPHGIRHIQALFSAK
eukprot:219098-Pelagomonas_calceolata.AAC.1